ncbi:uncharacterized protein ZBAI_07271 [Zygosaccharomyces bailii ISA1307]|nr:uncharacterized protein ZBAI_07271 [Zygosaccharomyces bailii ISA1307]
MRSTESSNSLFLTKLRQFSFLDVMRGFSMLIKNSLIILVWLINNYTISISDYLMLVALSSTTTVCFKSEQENPEYTFDNRFRNCKNGWGAPKYKSVKHLAD